MVKKSVNNKHNNSFSKEILIQEIDSSYFKKTVCLNGIVEKVIQTSGPTIFEITDGTGNFSLKGFVSPGVRAFSQINEGDCVKAIAQIEEFNGSIEGEIIKIFVKTQKDSEEFKKKLNERLKKRASVEEVDFLIDSRILDKLKPFFKSCIRNKICNIE